MLWLSHTDKNNISHTLCINKDVKRQENQDIHDLLLEISHFKISHVKVGTGKTQVVTSD